MSTTNTQHSRINLTKKLKSSLLTVIFKYPLPFIATLTSLMLIFMMVYTDNQHKQLLMAAELQYEQQYINALKNHSSKISDNETTFAQIQKDHFAPSIEIFKVATAMFQKTMIMISIISAAILALLSFLIILIRKQVKSANQLVLKTNKHNAALKQEVNKRIDLLKKLKTVSFQHRYSATHDTVTKLPNRLLFLDRLKQVAAQTKRDNKLHAVFFLDLDGFKTINDTLGHDIGDELLVEVAGRLTKSVRAMDTIARMGGDEFTAIITSLVSPEGAMIVAKNILSALSKPYFINNQELFVTASIGITLYPTDGEDSKSLIKNADTAMYHAKNSGRNTFQFYSEQLNASAFRQLKLRGLLHRAIEKNELVLFYQPQINYKTGKIIGAEALLRWQQSELGLISPMEFIPIAENCGLIIDIGEWVVKNAILQNKQWHNTGATNIHMAINISAKQFETPQFLPLLIQCIENSELDPKYIDIELTEGVLMSNPDKVMETLCKVKELGACISVDDFGTGYSSLSYLKQFPIDTLKIDRAFVKDILVNSQDKAIVKAILAMANSLNIDTIVEGVETVEQCNLLSEMGCVKMQGFLFSKPISGEACHDFITKHNQSAPIIIPNRGDSPTLRS